MRIYALTTTLVLTILFLTACGSKSNFGRGSNVEQISSEVKEGDDPSIRGTSTSGSPALTQPAPTSPIPVITILPPVTPPPAPVTPSKKPAPEPPAPIPPAPPALPPTPFVPPVPKIGLEVPATVFYGESFEVSYELNHVSDCMLNEMSVSAATDMVPVDGTTKNFNISLNCGSNPELKITKPIVVATKSGKSMANFGAPLKSDYLFIIDNSVSMASIIGNLVTTLTTFVNNVKNNVLIFPDDSRLAVMNTMIEQMPGVPGDDPNYKNTGTKVLSSYILRDNVLEPTGPITRAELVAPYPAAPLEPGFLSLVDRNSWQAFITNLNFYRTKFSPKNIDAIERQAMRNLAQDEKALMNQVANRWALQPCEQAWIDPNKDDPNCVKAAMQLSLSPVGAEAGVKALEQYINRIPAGEKMFRSGSIANIIFISDTHDPGMPQLVKLLAQKAYTLQDYNWFKNKILENNPDVKKVRFHGLVPIDKQCGEGEAIEPQTYKALIEESGGVRKDSCMTANYFDVIKEMVEITDFKSISFEASSPVKEVTGVMINGKDLDKAAFKVAGNEVTINKIDAFRASEIEISAVCYLKAADDKCEFTKK